MVGDEMIVSDTNVATSLGNGAFRIRNTAGTSELQFDTNELLPLGASVFAINGLGLYTVTNILKRDFIPLQGAVVVIAVGYVLINFAVDMFYAVLDPRIRHARSIA